MTSKLICLVCGGANSPTATCMHCGAVLTLPQHGEMAYPPNTRLLEVGPLQDSPLARRVVRIMLVLVVTLAASFVALVGAVMLFGPSVQQAMACRAVSFAATGGSVAPPEFRAALSSEEQQQCADGAGIPSLPGNDVDLSARTIPAVEVDSDDALVSPPTCGQAIVRSGAQRLNVRAAPSTDAAIVAKVTTSATVDIICEEAPQTVGGIIWKRVRVVGGIEGWVSAAYLQQ